MNKGYQNNQQGMPQGYRPQQQNYQNQQQQQQYPPQSQYPQQQQHPGNAGNRGGLNQPNNNQYDNYGSGQQQIEEESYDSSNVNNYTEDQYKQQHQNEYPYYQSAENVNPEQQQHNHNYNQEDNDYEFGQNPSSQYYQQMPQNQQVQYNPMINQKPQQNLMNYNDIHGSGKKQGGFDSDDSLASDVNKNQPFEEFEQFFDKISKDLKDNKISEALEVCEQMIYTQQRTKGYASFIRLFQQILKFLNNQAVNCLNQNQFDQSLLILSKCKELTELSILKSPPSIRALTYNNFGCYYRRLKQLPKALSFLESAQIFLSSIKSQDYLGMTYLNISAVLSQMNEHYASLENAKKAVVEIHKDYQNYLTRKSYEEAYKEQEFIDISQALAIAFYNVGVEQEYFQNYEASLINYGKAFEVSEDNLGANHRLTHRFKELYQKFKDRVIKSEKKQNQFPKGHRKLQARSQQSLQKNNLNRKYLNWQNSSVSSNENGAHSEQEIQQYKTHPYRQSYGIKANNFTHNGKNVYNKSTQKPINHQIPRISSAKQYPGIKISRPSSSKNNQQQIRPLSAQFQGNPSNGGFFQNSLNQKPNNSGANRPFSAQLNKNNQIGVGINKPTQPQKNIVRPQNKAKQLNRDAVIEAEDGNQNIFDWVDSPTNSSDSGHTSNKVLDNQKEFLKNIKIDKEAQIQKLQKEESDLKERIQKLKEQEQQEEKIRQQKLEDGKKKEEQEAERIKQNKQKQEEEERKRLAEIHDLKKREQEERENILKMRNKEQEDEEQRLTRLKEMKKKEEEEIERLKNARVKEEEEKKKNISDLEKQKIEEENKLKEIKQKAEEELKRVQQLENQKKQLSAEEARQNNTKQNNDDQNDQNKKEKEELRKVLEQEKAEKEKIRQEYERIKSSEKEKERIEKENQQLKQEKDKLLEEIQKLQSRASTAQQQNAPQTTQKQEEIKQSKKQTYNKKCQIVKRLNDEYDYGIQTNKNNLVIIHAIPLQEDERYPHFTVDIDLSSVIEQDLKENISKSLIQNIENSIKIKLKKKKFSFTKQWKYTETVNISGRKVDIANYDIKVKRTQNNTYRLTLQDKENLSVITEVVQESLDSTIKKAIEEVSPKPGQKRFQEIDTVSGIAQINIIQLYNKTNSQINDKQYQLKDLSEKKKDDKKQKQDKEIPEETVKIIQKIFKKLIHKEKSRKELKQVVKQLKQTLQNKIVYIGKYKLFLQCFKQISPEAFVVQVNSLNPKNSQLPKICSSKYVEKEFLDKVIASENPFKDNLIEINEQEGKVYFNIERKNNQKEPQKKEVEVEEEYEDDLEENKSQKSKKSEDKSGKKQNEDYNQSFDSISDDEDEKKVQPQDKQTQEIQNTKKPENKKEEKQKDIQYDEKHIKAATVIQHTVLSKKQIEEKKKEKVVLVQEFLQKFNVKFIFQLYKQTVQEKDKYQVTFENLMKKPSRWFSKLDTSPALSQEIISKSKERNFNPFNYFELIYDEQYIVSTELARNITSSPNINANELYKDIFFQVEQLSDETYLFCFQKLTIKGKDNYRIRAENLQNRNNNSITPIEQQIGEKMLKLKEENKLKVLDIFDLDYEDTKLTLKNSQQSKQILQIEKLFPIDKNIVSFVLTVSHNTSNNSLIFKVNESPHQIKEYNVQLGEQHSEDKLINDSRQIINRLTIRDKELTEFSQDQEKATLTLLKHSKQEVIIKREFFSLRLNDENGDPKLIQGECHIIRKMDRYFIALMKYETFDDLTSPLIHQQKISIGRLNKQQKNYLLLNFSTLINSNLTIIKNSLVFEDSEMFYDPQSVQIKKTTLS